MLQEAKKLWKSLSQSLAPYVGRGVVILYVLVVLGLSYFVYLSSKKHQVHYLAPRYLGPNSRLADSLLVMPIGASFKDRLALDGERRLIEGQYLKQEIEAGQAITPENVNVSPRIQVPAVAVELSVEPDWMFLNQGAKVQVQIGDKAESQQAEVVAIIKSGSRFWALLKSSDLGSAVPKDKQSLRVMALPTKP